MEELKQYINWIEKIVLYKWGKKMLSYDYEKCKWYSRYHGEYLTTEEMLNWVMDSINPTDDYDCCDDTLQCGCCAYCGCNCND